MKKRPSPRRGTYAAGTPTAVAVVRAFIGQEQRRRDEREFNRMVGELAPGRAGPQKKRQAAVIARTMASSYGRSEL